MKLKIIACHKLFELLGSFNYDTIDLQIYALLQEFCLSF